MTQPGQHTYREIITQPDAWRQAIEVGTAHFGALRQLWSRYPPFSILFTGCGSTYYLSLAAAALARDKGLSASAAPGSEVWLLTRNVAPQPEQTVLVAVSRSGETSETIHAVAAFRKAGGKTVLVVTNYPDSRLAQQGDLVLSIPAGQEQSVAQTRSFASMLVMCQIVVAAAADQSLPQQLSMLPDLGQRLIGAYGDLAARLGGYLSLQRFFFLGNGPLYGLACEAMLKMKEMSLTYSEAYHCLEIRHGPKSMIDDSALVVGLLSVAATTQETSVLADMKALGGRTLAIGAAPAPDQGDSIVAIDAHMPLGDYLVLHLPVLQLIAYHRSIAKGLDPDGPRNLTAVVVLGVGGRE